MGKDLVLLPFGGFHESSSYSFEVLRLNREEALFEAIERLPALPVPKPFDTYLACNNDGLTHLGDTQEDSYGKPLLATTMQMLKSCNIPGPQGAYIKASRDDQRVALYWR